MANARKANVWVIDTDGALNESVRICQVKVKDAGAGATLTIKKGGSSGTVIYTSTVGSNAERIEEVDIWIPKGSSPYVTLSAGTGYLYLK